MTTPQPGTFGKRLRRYRKAAHLTQEALAVRAGYSTVYIGMLERGERTALPATVDVLAETLGLTSAERVDLLNQASLAAPTRLPRPPRSLVRPPVVGRLHEIAVLSRFLGGTGRHLDSRVRSPVLFVAGEPGIGKSRLLDEAVVLAGKRGWRTLFGGCQRREGEEAYAPVVAALEGYVRRQAPDSLQPALDGAEWVARLLPELAAFAPIRSAPAAFGAVSPSQERRQIVQAVWRFLTNIAGPAGTLLALDDLQWAGADVFDLLTGLVSISADARERPLRIVGAYRDTELAAATPLASFLGDLAGKGLVTRVKLGPLGQEESAQLLHALLEPSAVGMGENVAPGADTEWEAELVRRAAGTPFYLVSFAQGLSAGALLDESCGSNVPHAVHAPGALDVPWTVSQTIRQRMATLSSAAQMVLRVVAIAGRTAERALVVAVARLLGHAEDLTGAGLDSACLARLLVEVGDDGYTFAHDLIREVVVGDLGAAQRARLHGLVAAVLEGAANPSPAALAYHYGRAGDQEHAVRYLELAGDRALELRAFGEAAGYYRELVERLERLGRADAVARVCERLGDVLISAGGYGPAMEVLAKTEDLYHSANSVEGLGRVLVQLGQVYGLRGRASEGLSYLLPRVEQLERQGLSAGGHAALLVTLGHLYTARSQHAELLTASERAIELARDAGDDRLAGRATMRRGIALAALGRLDEAVGAFDTAVHSSERTGDLWSLSIALSNQAVVYSHRGELVMARQRIEQAREAGERFGGVSMIALRWCESSQIAFLLGDWPSARRDVECAMSMLQTMEESWVTAYALTCLGELTAAEGRRAEAAPLLERAIRHSDQSGDLQVLRAAQRVAAEVDLLSGRPAAAAGRLQPLRDCPGQHETDVTGFLHLLAWSRLELGNEQEASLLADECIERARAASMRRALADGLRVRALVAVHAQDWASASRALEEAIDLCRTMSLPYAEAKLRYGYGLLHLGRHESRAAHAHFAAALSLLDRLGERLYAEQIRRALAAPETVSVRVSTRKGTVRSASTQ